jgi:hypothetical protein
LLHRRDETNLPFEALDAHAAGHLFGQHLHDDLPAKSLIHGQENPAHASAAELALDRVGIAKSCLKLVAKLHQAAIAFVTDGPNLARGVGLG